MDLFVFFLIIDFPLTLGFAEVVSEIVSTNFKG